MGRIELYKDKSDCCGCEACVNICKRNAIKMQEDEYGFYFLKLMLVYVLNVVNVKRYVVIRTKI